MRTRAIALFASLILVSSAPSAFADDGGEADEGTSKASRMKIELIADFVAGDDASFDDHVLMQVGDGALTVENRDVAKDRRSWQAMDGIDEGQREMRRDARRDADDAEALWDAVAAFASLLMR